jgi:hypothetical protein
MDDGVWTTSGGIYDEEKPMVGIQRVEGACGDEEISEREPRENGKEACGGGENSEGHVMEGQMVKQLVEGKMVKGHVL